MEIILFFQSTLRKSFPIATVVLQCGYRSDSFVKKMFLARTGMTMREYRTQHASGGKAFRSTP